MTEREFATEVVGRLREAGFEALFAGGCVRDQLFGLEPDDFDVATSAHPDEVQKLFRRSLAIGASFGVIEVLGAKPLKVQVATFRSDGPYADGRRPTAVHFSGAREDALRRDFTINGMFLDPVSGQVIDYVGGEADLRDRVLRAIGDPVVRFTEDRLRLLRAVRFAARFGLEMDLATWAAIQDMAGQVTTVSGERIAEELRKLLTHPSRARGAALLAESGLWSAIAPEPPPFDAAGIERLEPVTFPVALAYLLDGLAATGVDAVAERLRLSNAECDRVRWLVARRSLPLESLPLHQLKPLLAHDGIAELVGLWRATGCDRAAAFATAKLAEWPRAVLDPLALVTGEDLIARGLKPGPRFKEVLNEIRRAQLDGEIATRDDALAAVSRLAEKKMSGQG